MSSCRSFLHPKTWVDTCRGQAEGVEVADQGLQDMWIQLDQSER